MLGLGRFSQFAIRFSFVGCRGFGGCGCIARRAKNDTKRNERDLRGQAALVAATAQGIEKETAKAGRGGCSLPAPLPDHSSRTIWRPLPSLAPLVSPLLLSSRVSLDKC